MQIQSRPWVAAPLRSAPPSQPQKTPSESWQRNQEDYARVAKGMALGAGTGAVLGAAAKAALPAAIPVGLTAAAGAITGTWVGLAAGYASCFLPHPPVTSLNGDSKPQGYFDRVQLNVAQHGLGRVAMHSGFEGFWGGVTGQIGAALLRVPGPVLPVAGALIGVGHALQDCD